MIQDCVLLFDRWFKRNDYGINALLPVVPRENPDGGNFPEPAAVSIHNDCEDEGVARSWNPKSLGPTKRGVILWSEASVDFDLKGFSVAKRCIIGVGVLSAENVKWSVMTRETGYYDAAVLMSLFWYNKILIAGKQARELNGTKIMKINGITEQLVDGGKVGSSLIWSYQLVEVWAGSTLFNNN